MQRRIQRANNKQKCFSLTILRGAQIYFWLEKQWHCNRVSFLFQFHSYARRCVLLCVYKIIILDWTWISWYTNLIRSRSHIKWFLTLLWCCVCFVERMLLVWIEQLWRPAHTASDMCTSETLALTQFTKYRAHHQCSYNNCITINIKIYTATYSISMYYMPTYTNTSILALILILFLICIWFRFILYSSFHFIYFWLCRNLYPNES